jgi:hypothetical protein
MSVSVSVRLHAPCVAAGERVCATLTVSCSGAAPRAPLAYVVAQVSGRWTGDPAWIGPDAHRDAADPSASALDLHVHPREAPWDTALDDANRIGGGGRVGYAGIIFRSAPLAVCLDEPVPADASTSFSVHCVLPDVLPATLRGTALRYSYTFIVVAAMAGRAPQFVRVPFRVVTPEGTRHDRIIPVPTPRRTGPSPSRFLEEAPAYALSMSSALIKQPPPTDIEVALTASPNGRLTPFGRDDDLWKNGQSPHEEETPLNFMHYVPPSPRTPSSASVAARAGIESGASPPRRSAALPMYQISRGPLPLARMYLPKRVHHLGDTLAAVFDFHDAATRCYRLNARLECQEIVQPAHALGTKHSGAGAQGIIFRKVYGEHGEFVMQNRNTHVTFSIPHDAPVSFATSAVHVRWLVHFVFLIPKPAGDGRREDDSSAADGRGNVNGGTSGGADDTSDAGQSGPLTADDADATAALLAGVSMGAAGVATDADVSGEIPGWEGGAWRGDDPNAWKQLPQCDTDALRWTLPITVTNRHGSRWGACSRSTLHLKG